MSYEVAQTLGAGHSALGPANNLSVGEPLGSRSAHGCFGTLPVVGLAVVPPEVELITVPRQVLLAYVVERAVHPTFQEREIGLHRVGVHVATDVLT